MAHLGRREFIGLLGGRGGLAGFGAGATAGGADPRLRQQPVAGGFRPPSHCVPQRAQRNRLHRAGT
jgi:hypothetical protein